jgi:hypothetical protein
LEEPTAFIFTVEEVRLLLCPEDGGIVFLGIGGIDLPGPIASHLRT